MLSVLVLSANGYAWTVLRGLNGGVRGSDLIDANRPDGATDILLVGGDSRVDARGNPLPQHVLDELRAGEAEGDRTDTMILVRIPNGGGRATAMSFPRDTQVQLGRGYGENKLNSAFALAKNDARARLLRSGEQDPKQLELRSRAEGQRFLIQTINQLAGVSVDHYAEVNLLGFYQVTKAIGGVDVCLKQATSDPESGADFRAGPQTIQGADALAFVRQRHGPGMERSDLDRIVRQQVFLSALANKVLQAGTLGNPARLSALVDSVRQAVVLDEDWDVLTFARQMRGISGGDVEFRTAPVRLDESGEVQLSPSRAARFAQNLLLPPQQRQARERQQEIAERGRSATSVDVYNTTRTTGLAERVQRSLGGQGYAEGRTANAEPRSASVVQFAAGDEKAAQQVANSLGGLRTQQAPEASSGTVSVYLGEDYRGPGKRELAAAPAIRLDGVQRTRPQRTDAQRTDRGKQSEIEQQTITAGGVPCVN